MPLTCPALSQKSTILSRLSTVMSACCVTPPKTPVRTQQMFETETFLVAALSAALLVAFPVLQFFG